MLYGYARVSTKKQSTEIQEEALRKAGCEIIRSEKVSGTSRTGRVELANLIQFMRKGDVLVFTRLDRLARSLRDLSALASELDEKGCGMMCLEQPFNTSSSSGKALRGMLGVFAEFESDIRRERQLEGVEVAKDAKKYVGRPIDLDRIHRVYALKSEGLTVREIAKNCGISVQYVYKILSRPPSFYTQSKQKRGHVKS